MNSSDANLRSRNIKQNNQPDKSSTKKHMERVSLKMEFQQLSNLSERVI